jgi:ubiquinone biosynthesis protein UbiJ
MNKPPFSLPTPQELQALAAKLPTPPAPPEWLRVEVLQRVVLLLNHILQQEPAATDRLRRQQGKRMQVQWGTMELVLQATPAGLLSLCADGVTPDLRLQVAQTNPFELAQTLLEGGKPKIDIQGDVQLAAEVAWLVDNVRWDVEEDLSRIVGDAPAHTLMKGVTAVASAFKAKVRPA